MLDPDGLYELDPVQPQPGELERPVLVHALSGFVDAGGAGRLAAEHLLDHPAPPRASPRSTSTSCTTTARAVRS